MGSLFARLRPVPIVFFAALLLLGLSRLGLSLWTFDQVDLVNGAAEVFLGGFDQWHEKHIDATVGQAISYIEGAKK